MLFRKISIRIIKDELQHYRDLLVVSQEQLKTIETKSDALDTDKYPDIKEIYQVLISKQKKIITNVANHIAKYVNELKSMGGTE